MGIDKATLKIRSATAAVFVLVMLTGLFWSQWSFFILFSTIHFGCWWEYQQIIAKIDPGYKQITPLQKYGIQLAGWSLVMFCSRDDFHLGPFPLHAMGLWLGVIFLFMLPLIELLFARPIRLRNIFLSCMGILYVSIPIALCMDLYAVDPFRIDSRLFDIPKGYVVIFIIFSIWINDTMAYLVGSAIGKTPLSAISPKKTWEGTIGGVVLSIVVLTTVFYFFAGMKPLLLPIITLIGLATIAGTIGDLLESKLKRMAGIKDSGHFMPGHGGFLDRFDSLLIALPICWLFIRGYLAFFTH